MKKNLILFPLKNTGNHFRTVDQVCVCGGGAFSPLPLCSKLFARIHFVDNHSILTEDGVRREKTEN